MYEAKTIITSGADTVEHKIKWHVIPWSLRCSCKLCMIGFVDEFIWHRKAKLDKIATQIHWYRWVSVFYGNQNSFTFQTMSTLLYFLLYFLGIKCWLPPLHVIVDSQWNKYSKYFVTTASTYNCTVSLRAVSLREMMLSSCFALVVNLRVLISQYPDRDWFVCRWSCRALHVRLRLGRKI